MKPVYLDYNATTPVRSEVFDAMRWALQEGFGNPSSGHAYGVDARKAVERARGQVAELLGCARSEVVFTSGGSESNNMALMGLARALRHKGRHLVTSAVEHPAVTEVMKALVREGFEVTIVPVDETGRVHLAALEASLRPDTLLVSVMHANNEVGTLNPLAEISRIAHARGILVHTDAAQSVGKVSVRMDELGVDLLTVAGHKFYAPKGVGALIVRSDVPLEKLIHGADHEANRRAGTENVSGIVGLGAACELALDELPRRIVEARALRDRLWEALLRGLRPGSVRLNGHPAHRLPNTLSVGFRHVDASLLLFEIKHEVAASAGAACHVGEESSSVLRAMNVPGEFAAGTVRFSVGHGLTEQAVDRAADVVVRAVSAKFSEE